jgi:hypothetical protein
MKRFFFWTALVLVLAALAVLPTALALYKKHQTNGSLQVPNTNVVHVNVQPSDGSAGAATK